MDIFVRSSSRNFFFANFVSKNVILNEYVLKIHKLDTWHLASMMFVLTFPMINLHPCFNTDSNDTMVYVVLVVPVAGNVSF